MLDKMTIKNLHGKNVEAMLNKHDKKKRLLRNIVLGASAVILAGLIGEYAVEYGFKTYHQTHEYQTELQNHINYEQIAAETDSLKNSAK